MGRERRIYVMAGWRNGWIERNMMAWQTKLYRGRENYTMALDGRYEEKHATTVCLRARE